MICYHFVSRKSLQHLKKDGFLKPNTRLFLLKNINQLHKQYGIDNTEYKEIKNFAKKLPRNKFIVAIPKDRIKRWIASGLVEEIKYFIKPDYRLEFKTPRNCKIFTREHIYQSPKEIKKKYNKKMYMFVSNFLKTKIWVKYFKSTRMLKSVNDLKNIKVPELWLACKIPFDKIKITKA